MSEKRMSKSELVEIIAKGVKTSLGVEETEITASDRRTAKNMLSASIAGICYALEQGYSISLNELGTFTIKKRPARKGRNPQTGESIDIPAKNVVAFKSSPKLSDIVNAKLS